jgi:DMSO/TMAO reductase YedYZ heme-binding membrane subunit
MLKEFIFQSVLGLPIGAWGGLVGLIFLFSAAIVGGMVLKGKAKLRTHKILAILAILIALVHGIAFLVYFLIN